MTKDEALERAIRKVGGQTTLAELIGVAKQAVQSWRRVPPDRVLSVEAASGVPCWELRPDIYPPERFGNGKGKEGRGGKKGRAR